MPPLKGYRQKIRELSRFTDGERVTEVRLEPRRGCRYYWKALITPEGGRYRVRLFDRFERPYGSEPGPGEESWDAPLFDDLDEAKIYARRTLLDQ